MPPLAAAHRQFAYWLFALSSAIVLAVASWATSARAAPVISEAQIGPHPEGTRVVLAISAQVPYEAFTLQHPDRVVIDLPEVRWALRTAFVPRQDSLVAQIRHGRFKPGTSRVVIDCHGPVTVGDIAVRPAGGGWRMTIDLAGGVATSAAAAVAETASPVPHAPLADAPTLAPTGGGSARLQPVIGATGLAVGDVGPAWRTTLSAEPADGPARAEPVAAAATLAFAAPKPRPPAPRRTAAPMWVVAIDPGHGGQDPGAIGFSGVYEKRLTLATARDLREELQALGRYRVMLTRNRDVFIQLRDRIAIARAVGADLFVSLHADKMENAGVRGLSVYTLSERASDAEAAALAEKENKVDMLGGVPLKGETPEVTNILIDLVQRDTMNQSAQMASLLVRELRKETLLLPKAHRFAGFAVLKAPDVPSVLMELGYLSNPADEALLRSPQHRRKLGRAIARAIDGYFVSYEARNRLWAPAPR